MTSTALGSRKVGTGEISSSWDCDIVFDNLTKTHGHSWHWSCWRGPKDSWRHMEAQDLQGDGVGSS